MACTALERSSVCALYCAFPEASVWAMIELSGSFCCCATSSVSPSAMDPFALALLLSVGDVRLTRMLSSLVLLLFAVDDVEVAEEAELDVRELRDDSRDDVVTLLLRFEDLTSPEGLTTLRSVMLLKF